MNFNNINPVTIAAQERRAKALEFRAMGLTYKEIFEALVLTFGRDALPPSYDPRRVHRDCKEEMARLREATQESAAELRWVEAERLDMIQSRLMPLIVNGKIPDLKAVDRILKVMDHRAKLFGLYAPATLKVNDWRMEIIELYKAGKITKDMIADEYGEDFARELLEPGNPESIEGRFIEAQSSATAGDGASGEMAGETST